MTTATTSVSAPGAAPVQRRPRPPRWARFVIPLGVVALFWVATLGSYFYQEPNLSDPETLSPLGTGRHGSSQLAEMLQARGVTIERVTSSKAAIEAAHNRDATILVPAPDLLNGTLVLGLLGDPGRHRVVLLEPRLLGLFTSGVPAQVVRTRWAPKAVEPDCSKPEAHRAGPATVFRLRYGGSGLAIRCYQGGLVGDYVDDVEVLLVGSTNPFRNDRIGELGNATLATELLARHDLVIWVDVHARERLDIPPFEFELPDYARGELDRTNTGYEIVDAFPVQLWVTIAVLLVAGVLLAVAKARRLGPPVPEPLPVVVPAAETVTGRGRLYRRIRANQASLATLRASAVARLARTVDPFARAPDHGLDVPGPRRDAFVRTIAARARVPEPVVATVLFGPLPADDAGMVAAVADLDRLVATVLQPPGPRSDSSSAPNRPPEPGGSP